MLPSDPQVGTSARRHRMVLLVFGVGAAMGLHLGLLHWFIWHSWTAPVTFVAASLLFSGVSYGLWRWVLPLMRMRRFAHQVALETVACLVCFTIVSAGVVAMMGWLIAHGRPVGASPEVQRQWAQAYVFLPVLPVTAMTLISYHLVWRRMHALQSQARELRELAATAQLGALRAQLNPHFLFNSLNSIAQLVHTDPDAAEEHIERLAEILRYVLKSSDREFVRLADELSVTAAYLEIEQARFHDRLRIDASVAPAALEHMVPNLVLQPLVENALKHGLAEKLGPGTVSISAEVGADALRLAVRDDGVGMDPSALRTVFERGVGLRNLRERLQHLYGIDDGPEIRSVPGQGTTVEVVLPLSAGGMA